MGRILVTEFVSLDGVMEAPGGGEDFKYAGWTFRINRGDDGNSFKLDETMATEALLLGRVTYQGFAAAWPSRKGEFADKFNNMPKYVVSTTLEKADWNNTTVISGDVVKEVAALKQRVNGDIAVHGSARLAQTLLEHDVFPVVLGTGKRLFGPTSDSKALRLTEARTVGAGVAILIYRPADEEAITPQ